MLANYRFKVYRDYADDHVILAQSANSKREAIKGIMKSMKVVDGVAPKLSAFEFLSKNTLVVSLDKKYKTRNGKDVELFEIKNDKTSSPVMGNIVLRKSPSASGEITSRKTIYTGWSIHGEYISFQGEHKYDLIEQ